MAQFVSENDNQAGSNDAKNKQQNGSSSPGITQIGQVAVIVHDLARAKAFYQEVLEIPFLFEIPTAAFFDCGGTRLFLTLPEGDNADHFSSILYYKVTDIQGAYQALKARHVDLLDEPHLLARMPDHDLWMFFLRDPEGNTLGLMSEVRQK